MKDMCIDIQSSNLELDNWTTLALTPWIGI
jgi:hypothetical protein